MRYCHFGVSPVNYSDSDSDSDRPRYFRISQVSYRSSVSVPGFIPFISVPDLCSVAFFHRISETYTTSGT